MRVQPSTYTPRGCCGKGIPVYRLRLDTGEEKPLVLMLEKKANADRLTSLICAANPAAVVQEYVDPTR